MKHIFLILLVLTCNQVVAQDFVIEDNGDITFSKVINTNIELSKEELYKKVEDYFVYNYNDAKSVIQVKDPYDRIIGKGYYSRFYKKTDVLIKNKKKVK